VKFKPSVRLLVSVLVLAALGVSAGAQNPTPAEIAQKLTGTWVLNRELSKGFTAPGARPGGPGRGGAMFAVAPAYGQGRGGGGGQGAAGASDLSPAEIADMNAMRQLQQIAEVITIAAAADQITFTDARGERRYAIDGRSTRVDMAGEVTVKSRWDKATLRQEFSTAQNKLTQTWSVDENGRMVLLAKLESMRLRTPEQRAVFDRRP
jgi:hypothetical protein